MWQDIGGVWQDIEVLVLRKEAVLPDRCVICAAPASGNGIEFRLRYAHPAQHFHVLYWLLAIVFGARALVRIGVCERHVRQRRQRIFGCVILALSSAIIFGISAGPSGIPVLGAAAVLVFTASVFGLRCWYCPVKVDRMDDNYVWLKSVHPDYLKELRWFPQFGEMMDLE